MNRWKREKTERVWDIERQTDRQRKRDGQVWFVYLFGLFMSWPEQRVSPPIYNISKHVMWQRYSSFSLAKLHRQTFHRVREALCSEISPSIYLRTHTLSFLIYTAPRRATVFLLCGPTRSRQQKRFVSERHACK